MINTTILLIPLRVFLYQMIIIAIIILIVIIMKYMFKKIQMQVLLSGSFSRVPGGHVHIWYWFNYLSPKHSVQAIVYSLFWLNSQLVGQKYGHTNSLGL